MHRLTALALAVVALGVLTGAQGQDRPDLQLKSAVYKETVEGDLQGAIALYKQIVSNAATPRPFAAAALLGLGGCYEKVGETQARGAYEQLIAKYPEQAAEVAAARARLAALKAVSGGASSLPTLRLVWSGADVDSSGAISPDGRLLAYVNWDTGDLAMRDLQSGQSHTVTSKSKGGWLVSSDFAFSPRWSPDGKWLAYAWYDEKRDVSELRVTDLSGKNVRVVRSEPGGRGGFPVGWFPDGTALLVTVTQANRTAEIVRVALDNGEARVVRKIAGIASSRVCLSPDGRYIAFDARADSNSLDMDVFVMPSSGGLPTPVLSGPYDDRLFGWTPDGRRILAASSRSGAYDAWLVQIDEGRASGSPLLLRKDFGLVAPIGLSPGGAFYFVPDLAVRDVMLVDWDQQTQKATSAPRLASEHYTGATRLGVWSYDGRRLAYLVDRGNSRPADTRVRIRDLETGVERTLADVNGAVYRLAWSPDGTSVAMTVRRPPSLPFCQIVNATSGQLIREFAGSRSGEGVYAFTWGPDVNVAFYLAAAANVKPVLTKRDLRTGEETPLYTGAAGVPLGFAVARDGRQVAVCHARRIMIVAASGGEPRDLVPEAPGRMVSDAIAWSADGRYVYFGRRVEGIVRLYRVAAAGGAPEDLRLEIGEDLHVRPDGRCLAYTRLEGEARTARGEVWVMENFLPAVPGATAQKVKK